jgi:signal transduction histidine kinase
VRSRRKFLGIRWWSRRPPYAPRQLRFLPLAPAIVGIVGVAVAVAIALVGLGDLKAQSDSAASLRSQVLAASLAARLRATASEDRAALVERAARRSGAELLLVRQDGTLLVDGSLAPPSREQTLDLLTQGAGEVQTRLGRTRFSVAPLSAPLEHLALMAFVQAPEMPFAATSLVTSVAALTALLIGAAALVAFALAHDVHADAAYLGERIAKMAEETSHPAGKSLPIRSADQIALLTSAFNVLVGKFSAAEQAYRKNLSRALAYDRDRAAFLAALSHELRTPLNAILGFADVLLSEVDGPLSPDARENITVVRASGDHLSSLISDVLDLSALESGELRLSLGDVDVYAVAESVVREAQVNAQWKPLVVLLQGEHAVAWADPLRVRQILGNVVSNAVKFTNEGVVRVRIEQRGEFVAIVVVDTGPGIAPNEQAAIFEEYRQSGDDAARHVGTGLGLAITRRLVSMHGGYVELDSEVGQGSRFTILLPTASAAGRLAGTPRTLPTIRPLAVGHTR